MSDAESYINRALQGDKIKAMRSAMNDNLPEIEQVAINTAKIYRAYYRAFCDAGFSADQAFKLSLIEVERLRG